MCLPSLKIVLHFENICQSVFLYFSLICLHNGKSRYRNVDMCRGCKMDKFISHDNACASRANVNRILCLFEVKMSIKCTNLTLTCQD